MRWIEMDCAEGKPVAQWMRSTGVSDDGTIFVPAAMAGDEEVVLLCTQYDGIAYVDYLEHKFVPLKWMAKEFIETKKKCGAIESFVRSVISEKI